MFFNIVAFFKKFCLGYHRRVKKGFLKKRRRKGGHVVEMRNRKKEGANEKEA